MFHFTKGTKYVFRYTVSKGIPDRWFEAWGPQSEDKCDVILSDDLELIPLWFICLMKAWTSYGSRTDMVGVSLFQKIMKASNGEAVGQQVGAGPFM